jgi:hypothetical protein
MGDRKRISPDVSRMDLEDEDKTGVKKTKPGLQRTDSEFLMKVAQAQMTQRDLFSAEGVGSTTVDVSSANTVSPIVFAKSIGVRKSLLGLLPCNRRMLTSGQPSKCSVCNWPSLSSVWWRPKGMPLGSGSLFVQFSSMNSGTHVPKRHPYKTVYLLR